MTIRRPDDKLPRRQFIRIAGIGVAAPVFLTHCSDDETTPPGGGPPIEPGEQFFPQSIASGDPTSESVVLWARLEDEGAELAASLVISRDEAQADVIATQAVVARADNDFVLKLRVSGLEAGTTYYYRFLYDKAGTLYGSRLGRTKTAPAADADVPVKFAFASCQDFIGRYYNSYAKMLELVDDLDFFVHLGDYIYETTGDPGFQSEGGERRVVFTDTEGAIAFTDGDGEVTHYAARSLDNYRELYKTYRSDPFLQQVHEKLPMVSIWDDHEFSDDCWKDNATYFDGRVNEDAQTERRQNAERAHFEFMPLDRGLSPEGDGLASSIETPITDPGAVLYRDLRFGKHLHLVVTDTRTYRPDHPIREDAFYGRVILTEAELTAEGIDPQEVDDGGLPIYAPYVDIDAAAWSAHRAALVPILTDAYKEGGPGLSDAEATALAEAAASGNVSATVVNELLADAITAGTLTAIDTVGLPRGMTIDHLRFQKKFLFANDGIHARYLVHQARYELWQKVAFAKDPSVQDVFGSAQEDWLRDVLTSTDATWKVLGTSISFTSMIIDVSDAGFPPTLVGDPDEELIKQGTQTFQGFFDAPYLFSVDQWDGFPQKRAQLFDWMREIPNVVSIAGDIHSSYVTDHGDGGKSHHLFELTGTGISSEPFKGFVREKVDAVVPGATQSPSISALIERLEDFLLAANPTMVHASNDTHGFVTVEVTADAMSATFHYADEDHVVEDSGGDVAAAAAPFQSRTFVISGNAVTAS